MLSINFESVSVALDQEVVQEDAARHMYPQILMLPGAEAGAWPGTAASLGYVLVESSTHSICSLQYCRPASKMLHLYALCRRVAPDATAAVQPADELELSRALGLALLAPLPAVPGFTSQLSSGTDVQVNKIKNEQ